MIVSVLILDCKDNNLTKNEEKSCEYINFHYFCRDF